MTITDALLRFSGETRFEQLPEAVVHEARRYALDASGCALGGHAVGKGRIAAACAAEQRAPDEAGIIGVAGGVAAGAAAFANAELINALDHDSLPHVVPVTLPPVLAAAQAVRADGRALIVALVVAHEIGQRLAQASSAMIRSLAETGSTPQAFGINNEALIGAALGASRLFGHGPREAGHALGLAAYFCSLPVARDWEEAMPKSMVKYTPMGVLAQNALQAVRLAGAGYTGHPEVLDSPFGFARFHRSGRWEPELVTRGLGAQWAFLDQQYKPWPCCRFFHSQLDLVARLVDEHRLRPEDIAGIDCHGARFVANPRPYDVRTHVDVQFSLPFCVALVVHRVSPDAAWQREETLARLPLHDFARRVRQHADPRSLAAKGRDPRSWWARVRIELADGRSLQAETEYARGTNGTSVALDDAALEAKFRAHARSRLDAGAVERAVRALWQLEQLSDVRELARLLAPTEFHCPEGA